MLAVLPVHAFFVMLPRFSHLNTHALYKSCIILWCDITTDRTAVPSIITFCCCQKYWCCCFSVCSSLSACEKAVWPTLYIFTHCYLKLSDTTAQFCQRTAECWIVLTYDLGCTNPNCKVTQVNKFGTVAPNICGYSIWKLLRVTLLAPRILR
jgi:hypothetical protein